MPHVKPTIMNRRRLLTASLAGAAAAAGATIGARQALAAPNGVRPTQLAGLAVTSVNASTMRVSGRWTTADGLPVVGLAVLVYAVYTASIGRWATIYTDNSGNFNATMPKVPAGAKIQIEAEGNGAYCRPYPTFARV